MANCEECKRKRAACAETDHSDEWSLSKELISENKRLRLLCATSLVTNALMVIIYFITH